MKLLLVTLAALALTTAAHAGETRTQQQQKLTHSTHVIRFFQNHHWMLATQHTHCTDVPWTQTCRIARGLHAKHQARAATLRNSLWRTLPHTNDWRTSVTLTQRIYPGTSQWLLFISAREGGYGRFVMNHQGSGAGGWMQFMRSTFYAYMDDARQSVNARGFTVPANIWTWTHPLGQALTAGYMRYTGRDGCHWCLT